MGINNDICWEQRFSNYQMALRKLSTAVRLLRPLIDDEVFLTTDDGELQVEGLIQRFEYTHELAWKVMKDYAIYQGYQDINGSRDATRYALQTHIIFDQNWMQMIASRNHTSHTYDNDTAKEVLVSVVEIYFQLFVDFEERMRALTSSSVSLLF